jgi:hypothetical protein
MNKGSFMIPNLMIFDNFYSNAKGVRDYALSLPFSITGNYPGVRTDIMRGEHNTNAKTMFEDILRKKITWWPEEYNTAFQFTTSQDKTWVHYDPTNWAAVLYLTPDAPLESGTAIYRNKESKVFMLDRNDPKTDYNSSAEDINEVDKWEPIIQVSNIFNRLVIYRGEYYHRSMLPGFGDNQYNGRLFQTFFFNLED